MKNKDRKFFRSLLYAFLLFLAIVATYAWFMGKGKPQERKPAAVCGQ
jgi:hypothetical protein